MGISGLFPFCEQATRQITINQIRGKTVAVDSYCLLHRGAYSCSDKLIKKIKTSAHIDFAMKFVLMLQSVNIIPIMVFDGRNLPAKAETEARRRRDRDTAKEKAKEFLREGKTDEARREFAKAVDITHEHAIELMKECRKVGVDSVTAMYEADGQLAYLNKIGLAEYVISEDSDLIIFGCKKILFKLQLNGHCLLFEADKLHLTLNTAEEKFCFEKFRRMCILSGCDYLDNLPGIGLAKARKFIMMTEETDMKRALLKIPSYLNMKKLTITDEYINGFLKAEATFLFMFVYDTLKREMCRLNPLEEGDPYESYCGNAGALLKADVAFQLALGNLNPRSLVPMDNFNPDAMTPKKSQLSSSIWTKEGRRQTAPIFKHQSKIKSFFTIPQRVHKQLAEVQNITEQENNVSCELEIDDLVSSYIADTPMLECPKRRSPVYDDEMENESMSFNPFAKRHQSEKIETAVKPSLLSSLTFVNKFEKTPVNQNHRIISRFFASKNPPQPNEEVSSTMDTDETSTESHPEITELHETYKEQTQKLKEFYDSIKTSESIEESTFEITEELSSNEAEESTIVVDLDQYKFKPKKQTYINDIKPKVIPIKSRVVGLGKQKIIETSTQTKLEKFGFKMKPK